MRFYVGVHFKIKNMDKKIKELKRKMCNKNSVGRRANWSVGGRNMCSNAVHNFFETLGCL